MKTWFENENKLKWLLIFDNADEIHGIGETGSVRDLIPQGEGGCVLVTSRNRASDGGLTNAGYEVVEMKQSEAVEFLLQGSRKIGPENVQNAQILVEKPGYLPLAIEKPAATSE